ncbi:mediator of RNA polymerase II transcription subunit 6 [Pancytospora philotis]|nr:mediator of RNA polymerase II transcription subunit 6 [Pancytospora philotis]
MVDEEHICFYNQNFLAGQPLTADNAIEYFASSTFYDKRCTNEILRMQSQFSAIDTRDKLHTIVGFYYALEHAAQDLFVIAKKEYTGAATRTLQLYYCLHGYIYVAPTTRALSESRMIGALVHINEALDMYEAQKRFSWLEGFQFRKGREVKEREGDEIRFVSEAMYDFERGMHKQAK